MGVWGRKHSTEKTAGELRVKEQKSRRHEKRRIQSELELEKSLKWHLEEGVSYHCLSGGGVDSLSYLRCIVKEQKLEYVLISTWCMSAANIEEIYKWVEAGYIKRVDIYVGEIFKTSYGYEYEILKKNQKKYRNRLVIFKNHSKIISFIGERYSGVIEASANMNENPRMEQAVITVDKELAMWYKNIFDEIESWDKEIEQGEVYKWVDRTR